MSFSTDAVLRILQKKELIDRRLPDVWWAEFRTDVHVHSEIAGDFVVPAGFLTDGASIPRFFWRLLAPNDPEIHYPSFAHDLLYSLDGALPEITLTRQQSDGVIREQMLEVGAPKWKADAVYYALRLGGSNSWTNAQEIRKQIKKDSAHRAFAMKGIHLPS
jgi:hypothetical protein